MLILRLPSTIAERKAVTLIEVLIAIFVMALGILCLMAMFPLGAVWMAQAVKDDRTSTLAMNSETMARIFWRDAFRGPGTGGIETNENTIFNREPSLMAMDNPAAPTTTGAGVTTHITTAPYTTNRYLSGPGYPVFIDPIGENTWTTVGDKTYIANPTLGTRIPRRTLLTLASAGGLKTAACIRYCSLLDDMTFNTQGLPDTSSGVIDRGGRFSVAWVLQRKQNNIRSEANLKVVVYQNRPPATTPTAETAYNAIVRNGANSITLITGSATPPLRKGSWVMDATIDPGTPGIPRADFYRVIAVTQNGSQTNLELQQPVRLRSGVQVYDPTTGAGAYVGVFVVLDNVVEVFDRGTLTPTAVPAP